jgi:uncharacterized membrane protein YphA (DoxX/SURF4 family)
MPFLQRLLSKDSAGADVLRLWLCITIFTHGANRLAGGDAALAPFLDGLGLPAGHALAQAISVFEVAAALLLALRIAPVALSLACAALYGMSIVLFHRQAGFFVVGPGNNGWEFAALLATCLLVTAWENRSAAKESV